MRLLVCCLMAPAACSHVATQATLPPALPSDRGPTEAYLRADVALFLSEGDAQAMDALSRRVIARRGLERIPATEEEVLAGLASHEEGARDAALVNVLAKGGVSEAEFLAILSEYSSADSFFVRYHSMQVLAMADTRLAMRHGDELAAAAAQEGNDAIRRVALTLATKLAPEERMRVMVEFVRTGSPSLARDTYAAAWSLGHEMGCSLRSRVIGASEVSGDVLRAVERAGGLPAFALPNAGCSDSRAQ